MDSVGILFENSIATCFGQISKAHHATLSNKVPFTVVSCGYCLIEPISKYSTCFSCLLILRCSFVWYSLASSEWSKNTPGLPDSRLCLEDTKGLGRRGWTDWHQGPTAANASESSESGFPTEQLDQIADHVGHLAPICSCYEKCLNHAKARPSPMC